MSAVLAAEIRDEVVREGPISFRRFMELALYHPEHGYYTSGRAQVGRKGDFFTNVSVGPLFGKLLARQFAEMWRLLGRPTGFCIVDQGAHEGHFAGDVLGALKETDPDCFAATAYRIVEPSSALALRQRERLIEWPVEWVPDLSGLPIFTGVHFSNELIDAFPVHVLEWTGREWLERCVTSEGMEFRFTNCPITLPQLATACARIPQPLPPGYVTEINLAAETWIADVAGRMKRGFILAVDYGFLRDEYYRPERFEGTLSAYAHHRRENDPLKAPGEIDLTAHVDFSSLMEAGIAAGLRVAGFTDQHHLMVGLGAAYFNDGIPANTGELRAFQTLMHPTLMGMAFKAVAFQKGVADDTSLMAFRYASRS
jgi:SAM-dependent MidA family methyltransferase